MLGTLSVKGKNIGTKIKDVKLNSCLKANPNYEELALSLPSCMLMANGIPVELEINRVMFSVLSVGKLMFRWSLPKEHI